MSLLNRGKKVEEAPPTPRPSTLAVYRELLAAYEGSHAKYLEVSVAGQGNIRERIDCQCDGCTKVRELLNQ